MSYVNNTGKNIGQCLTGFGISYPITIYNSGNYPVSYSVTNTSTSIFTVSSNSFSLDSNDSKILNVNYIPTITASEAQDTFSLQVLGTSQENNTVDPSGAITINLTGQRKINITGGNVRSLHNYVIREKNETSYTRNGFFDFYWLPPSGLTGQNLNNYFITGYVLEIANNTSFTSASGYSIGIQKNTSETPRFSTVNGFGDILLNYKIADSFEIEDSSGSGRNYYARMYTLSNGNTGASVYSTGILPGDFLNEQVINGNTTTIPNINVYGKVLSFEIEAGNYIDFDLYEEILTKVNNENDFSLYTGIEIYFNDNSEFTSSSRTKFPLSLEGALNNYSGGAAGKVIDFYFGENVVFKATHGDDQQSPNTITSNGLKPAFHNYTDATSGGDVFNLKPCSKINGSNYTDFTINVYIKPSCSILSGGGGNKSVRFLENAGKNQPKRGVFKTSANKFFGQDGSIGWLLENVTTNVYEGIVSDVDLGSNNRTKNNSAGKIFQKDSNTEIYLSMESYTLPQTPYFRFKSSDISSVSSWSSDASYTSLTLTQATVAKQPSIDTSLIYTGLKFSSADEMSIAFSSTSVIVNDFDLFFVLAIEDISPENGLNKIFNWYSDAQKIASNNFKTRYLYNNRTQIKQLNQFFYSNTIDYPNYGTSNSEFYPNGSSNDEIIPINFSCFFSPLLNNSINNFDDTKYKSMREDCQDFISRNSYNAGSVLYNSTTTNQKVPLFINIRRIGRKYSIFVNTQEVSTFDFSDNSYVLTEDLKNTVFQLVSDKRNFTVFDILFYNRSLSSSEKTTVNNFLAKEYFKLITGFDEFPYKLSRNRIKLPNLFNIAGRI